MSTKRSGQRRSYVSVACDNCRLRKKKCSGELPICNNCLKARKTNCMYNSFDKRKLRHRNHQIQDLQEKNFALISFIEKLSKDYPDVQPRCNFALSDLKTRQDIDTEYSILEIISAFKDSCVVHSPLKEEWNIKHFNSRGVSIPDVALKDLVDVNWEIKIDEDGNTELIGPTSNQVRNIKGSEIVERISRTLHPPGLPKSSSALDHRESFSNDQNESQFQVDYLMEQFDSFMKRIIPLFPTFKDMRISSNDISSYPNGLPEPKRFLFSSIFAYESILGASREENGKNWFLTDAKSRIFSLLDSELYSEPLNYLELIQGLIILSVIGQAQRNNHDAWIFNSIIISTIKRMGLHISTDLPIEVSENSGEVILKTQKRINSARNRLLWSCISSDRILAVLYGCGCMMDSKKLKTSFDPSDVHDELQNITDVLNKNTIMLWGMLDEILSQTYCYGFSEYEDVRKMDLLLKTVTSFKIFYRKLPRKIMHMATDSAEQLSCIIFFHLSFYVFLMLVEKPFCNVKHCQRSCIENCIEISNISTQLIALLQSVEIRCEPSYVPFYYGYFLFTLLSFHLTLICAIEKNGNEYSEYDVSPIENQFIFMMDLLALEARKWEMNVNYIDILHRRYVDWRLDSRIISTIRNNLPKVSHSYPEFGCS